MVDLQQVIVWLRRLANLDFRVFEEVRTNPTATIPGFLVVLVSTLLAGLGGWLWWVVRGFGHSGDILVNSAIIGSLLATALWCLWVVIVYVMLTQVLRQRAYLEQLLRVMGLAAAPLALMGLMFIPGLSFAIGITSLALAFTLTTVAIRTVTTAEPPQVLLANAAGFFVWATALTLLASSGLSTVKPHAPGIFLYNATSSIAHDFIKATGG